MQQQFSRFARNVVVLKGGMTETARKDAEAMLDSAENDERLVLSTGRYLGEGFDDPRLDTLFLTMPISWKGTLAQYVGRLHRNHHDKTNVVVYDYVDPAVPVLARMAARRQAGYRALGYLISQEAHANTGSNIPCEWRVKPATTLAHVRQRRNLTVPT
jgi:superfamily II DNA or RNA helicase